MADFLCFYLYAFDLDGVSAGYFLFAPSCVPLLQIDRVGSDSHEYTVVEIDAVAVEMGGELLTVVSRGQAVLHRTGRQKHEYCCNARYRNGPE